nr:hypothetical protein [Tanacetum cinerariifolium]
MLAAAIQRLCEVKIERMQRSITCKIAASEQEITEHNLLSVEFINYVETDVSRLESLKSSKMKELVVKKRIELEDVCMKTHMLPEPDSSM